MPRNRRARCAVSCCSTASASFGEAHVRFHILPKYEPERSMWLRRIGRECDRDSDLRVCSNHFRDSDYERDLSVMRSLGHSVKYARLKPGVLPSVRLPVGVKPPRNNQKAVVLSLYENYLQQGPPELQREPSEQDIPYHCWYHWLRPAVRDAAVQTLGSSSPATTQVSSLQLGLMRNIGKQQGF